MPYIQAPGFSDYLSFGARSLFPALTPSLGLTPHFSEAYFPSLEASRVTAHEASLMEQHSALASHHHNHHLSPDPKLGLSTAFDMKSLLMSGHNHCQSSSNPNHGITCSAAYNLMVPCGCPTLHPSAQTSSSGMQSFGSMAHSSNSTSTIASTSTSQSNLIRPKLQLTQRLDDRNKSNSESPSPHSFRVSHPTAMSNNSSASSSPSSPVPTHSFNPQLLGLYSHYINGKSYKQ